MGRKDVERKKHRTKRRRAKRRGQSDVGRKDVERKDMVPFLLRYGYKTHGLYIQDSYILHILQATHKQPVSRLQLLLSNAE